MPLCIRCFAILREIRAEHSYQESAGATQQPERQSTLPPGREGSVVA